MAERERGSLSLRERQNARRAGGGFPSRMPSRQHRGGRKHCTAPNRSVTDCTPELWGSHAMTERARCVFVEAMTLLLACPRVAFVGNNIIMLMGCLPGLPLHRHETCMRQRGRQKTIKRSESHGAVIRRTATTGIYGPCHIAGTFLARQSHQATPPLPSTPMSCNMI